MKRDMDLVREILLFAEEHSNSMGGIPVEIAKLTPPHNNTDYNKLSEHIRLVVERGLLVGDHSSCGWSIDSLTWEGHEFLDNARVSEVWNAAKTSAGHLSFGVFRSVLDHLAINHGLALLKSGFDATVAAVT